MYDKKDNCQLAVEILENLDPANSDFEYQLEAAVAILSLQNMLDSIKKRDTVLLVQQSCA